jgi:hypothetical protein
VLNPSCDWIKGGLRLDSCIACFEPSRAKQSLRLDQTLLLIVWFDMLARQKQVCLMYQTKIAQYDFHTEASGTSISGHTFLVVTSCESRGIGQYDYD